MPEHIEFLYIADGRVKLIENYIHHAFNNKSILMNNIKMIEKEIHAHDYKLAII